jgi:hypothetical protein
VKRCSSFPFYFFQVRGAFEALRFTIIKSKITGKELRCSNFNFTVTGMTASCNKIKSRTPEGSSQVAYSIFIITIAVITPADAISTRTDVVLRSPDAGSSATEIGCRLVVATHAEQKVAGVGFDRESPCSRVAREFNSMSCEGRMPARRIDAITGENDFAAPLLIYLVE